jgi:hypothetical protein
LNDIKNVVRRWMTRRQCEIIHTGDHLNGTWTARSDWVHLGEKADRSGTIIGAGKGPADKPRLVASVGFWRTREKTQGLMQASKP